MARLARVNDVDLLSELTSFAQLYTTTMEKTLCKKDCNQCFVCCYIYLYKYNMHSAAYSNLFVVYEYLLTLSFTQVECERAFSKLKIIKNRLRSSMTQQKLEAFMLMSTETQLLEAIEFDEILTILKKTSNTLSKMLSI